MCIQYVDIRRLPELIYDATSVVSFHKSRQGTDVGNLRLQVKALSPADMSVVSSYSSPLPSPALRCLSLESQGLGAFPEDLERRVHEEGINELILARNRLSPLPPEIGSFTGLKKLDVSSNRLTELPEQLCELKGLEVLLVKRNALKSLPERFGQLKLLRELNISGNRLEKFPPQIASLEKLEILHLGGNRLRAIPRSIAQLKE